MAGPALKPPHAARPAGSPASTIRVRTHPTELRSRALRRVAEYLRALGLCDEARVRALAEEISAEAARAGADGERPEAAVAAAQARFERYRRALFGAEADAVDALWLRAFIAAAPEHFLADPERARRASLRFGDPRAGRPPARARFRVQELTRLRLPRAWLALLVPVLLTASATTVLLAGLARTQAELRAGELGWTALFALLFGLGAITLQTAAVGFARELGRIRRPAGPPHPHCSRPAPLPRSALVVPIYHEDAEHVFASLAAMRESLTQTPGGEAFELFVLSDSRDPEAAAEEERAFRRVALALPSPIPIYYRRRTRNERQKAGNLAEFLERFGDRYTYAVVLDADSLMRGDTLVELVRRMEAKPELALLQAPLELRGGATLFARLQQLAGALSGPVLLRGLAALSGPHGNYYGHNAVLRVRAFLDCCALPELAGEPPLGGHILSHDFVEAALLCRAGWEVRIADDLHGSWEELPQSLLAHVARDRRWCQGNLQHLRVALAAGLKPISRLHLLLGAAMYLAGPAWLGFVSLGVALASSRVGALLPAAVSLGLVGACAGVLLGPRLLGLCATLLERERRAAHGGGCRLCASALIETVFSSLLAPLFMLHHTRGVLSILFGRSVAWGAQPRRAAAGALAIARSELPATLLGLGGAIAIHAAAPALLAWLAPAWAPLAFAIPLALLASSRRLGRLLARAGLLLVPSETRPDELLLRAAELRTLTLADQAARFRDLVLDPVLIGAHLRRLAAAPRAGRADELLARLCQRALRVGPAGLSAAERATLASDAESMRLLHCEAWRSWPVESWQLGRDLPQLPPEGELA